MLNELQMRNRIQWVRALLSGDFEQGHARLKRTKRIVGDNDSRTYEYCCLGVACERIEPGNYALRQESSNAGNSLDTISIMGFLDSDFAEEQLGISYEDQKVAGDWNDAEKLSFARIADRIAYATVHFMTLSGVNDSGLGFGKIEIPDGFATEWLEQFND